jgi:Uma2 family endonuclease
MATQPVTRLTPEQYLQLDRTCDVRNGYYNGEMYAMAGGSPRHSQIIVRLSSQLLVAADRRGCTTYSSDLRIKSGSDYFYADVSVVCGPVQLSDRKLRSRPQVHRLPIDSEPAGVRARRPG